MRPDEMIHGYPARVVERVLCNVNQVPDTGCWESLYAPGTHGYAQVGWRDAGRMTVTGAHRVAWASANGPIPPEMTVDHICHNIICVNPAHLRLKTNVDNAKDNVFATKTHCPQGHPYDEANTYVDRDNHRRCRTCQKARQVARNKSTKDREEITAPSGGGRL